MTTNDEIQMGYFSVGKTNYGTQTVTVSDSGRGYVYVMYENEFEMKTYKESAIEEIICQPFFMARKNDSILNTHLPAMEP